MNLSRIAIATIPLLFLSPSCKSEDASVETADESQPNTAKPSKRPKLSEVMKVSREMSDYKEKIGYEDSPEIKALMQEQTDAVFKAMDIRQNHPTLKKIAEESAEAQTKLMEAVQNKDDAAQQKWGPIAGQNSMRRLEAAKEIPELAELDEKAEALGVKIEQMQYELISAEPEGKKIADEVRRITKAFSGE